MYVSLAAIVVILLTAFILKVNKKRYYKLKRNLEFVISLPGASILSSFINTLKVACNYKDLLDYVEETTKKYGSVTRLVLGTDIFVLLTKPEDYKLVLVNENGNDKSSVTKLWDVFLGDGVIRASGTTHRVRRKILQPLLNLKNLSEYVTFFDSYSNYCADTLEKHVDGPIFDLKPYIARYSFNIFLVTTVGIQGAAHKGEDDELLYWQEKLLKESFKRVIKPWLQTEWIFSLTEGGKQMSAARKIVEDFIYSISSRETPKQTALQYNAEMFEKSKPIFNNYSNRLVQLYDDVTSKSCEVSDENFLDDIRNFLVAIQNTTTEVASFIMLMLGMHTEVQEKLREEILVTFNNDKVDAQRLLSMRYFQMVFQETLRLFPIAPALSRELTGDIKLESCTLPEGCYIMIPIFAIHRNPAYWHKPLEFIPERFSAENSSSRPRYTYIPFGTGLRDCLGQRYALLSVAAIVVNLVRRFRFTTVSNIADVKLATDIILRTQDARLSISRI
ncbi:PREDICTED: cytochrome P450 4C1-like [Wasmannia auropunctata]|uniref:cytochrome P450 4C1-like n=1 Tax=Wasmannia auropunctata TaxID=64793 RepID=UPI0005EED555|nr:PREDICTED: cytochrome P450 4C1-like [Wasmannia auropunctata]